MKRFTIFLLIFAGIAAVSVAQNFRQEGIASFYGREFAGRPTASGEIFNPALYTAAHKELPFGTILTVTNKQNMRQVTVRINDRGPFVDARIIDLSSAAAEALDMLNAGIAPVILEPAMNTTLGPVQTIIPPVSVFSEPDIPLVIYQPVPHPIPQPVPQTVPQIILVNPMPMETPSAPPVVSEIPIIPPVSPPPVVEPVMIPVVPPVVEPAKAPVVPPAIPAIPANPPAQVMYPGPPARIVGTVPQAESTKSYRLQVGAYKIPRNAVDAFTKLKNAGLNPEYERHDDFYRVVLNGLKAKEIPSVAQTLGNHGFREAIIREEN